MTSVPALLILTAVAITSVAVALPHRPRRPRHPRPVLPVAPGSHAHRPHHREHPHEILMASVLRELHLDVDPATSLAVLRCAAALGGAVALLVAGPAAAALAGSVMLTTPRLARRVLARRDATRRDDQLVPMLEHVAADLRAGSALGPAFVAVARNARSPLGDDLRVVAAEIEHGAALGHALDRWGGRAPAGTPVHMVVAALTVAAEAGGEVARSVDRLATTLRERRDLRAEVRALATQARASAAVLVTAPLGFAALVAGIEPGAIAFLVASPVGLLCLGAGLTLDALGATWMARILRDTP